MQDDHLRARHAKKKKDRTTESRKWQSRGVKINEHDEALLELKDFWSAWTIEQHAYKAPYHLRARDAKKKMDRTTEYRKWQGHGVKIN